MTRLRVFRCACAFGKSVNDKDPTHFPRVGIAENVLLRGHWIIRHSLTGEEALIVRNGEPALHAEAAPCCFNWFTPPEDAA